MRRQSEAATALWIDAFGKLSKAVSTLRSATALQVCRPVTLKTWMPIRLFALRVKLSSNEGISRPSLRDHGCAISRNFVLDRFLLSNIDKFCRTAGQMLQGAQLMLRSEVVRLKTEQPILLSER